MLLQLWLLTWVRPNAPPLSAGHPMQPLHEPDPEIPLVGDGSRGGAERFVSCCLLEHSCLLARKQIECDGEALRGAFFGVFWLAFRQ